MRRVTFVKVIAWSAIRGVLTVKSAAFAPMTVALPSVSTPALARVGGTLLQAACELPVAGNWFAPALFTDVEPSSTVMDVEIFGPVAAMMTFRTPEEAVQIANHTRYGLAATVWSENINLALDTAARMKAGVVWINSTNLFDAAAGFGGYKESGFGREGGRQGRALAVAAGDANVLGARAAEGAALPLDEAWVEVVPRADGNPGCEVRLASWQAVPLPRLQPAHRHPHLGRASRVHAAPGSRARRLPRRQAEPAASWPCRIR